MSPHEPTMSAEEELAFVPAEGRREVSAVLLRPRSAKVLYVLGHGAGAGMRHRFMQAIAEQLAARDIATLRYNFPYTQEEKKRPDPQKVLLSTVHNAILLAKQRAPGLALFAGGKSMGGRMTSLLASTTPLPGLVGLAFLGFPLHGAGRPSRERAAHLHAFDLPLLFVQGSRDKLCELEELRPLVQELGSRATLHVLPDGDHSFSMPKRSGRTEADIRAEVADVVADWMNARV
jgi:predicted alpha/beta-hydrolase family hydrolase